MSRYHITARANMNRRLLKAMGSTSARLYFTTAKLAPNTATTIRSNKSRKRGCFTISRKILIKGSAFNHFIETYIPHYTYYIANHQMNCHIFTDSQSFSYLKVLEWVSQNEKN